MPQIVPVRHDDAWVNQAGELSSPRFVVVVDGIGKNIVSRLSEVGFDERDQLVQFSKGEFKTVNSFLKLKAREFANVKAFVFLWFGMDELACEAPPTNNPTIESYFLPQGPRIMPKESVESVVELYTETVALTHVLFPAAVLFSTDPAPRRSTGFAITRAMKASSAMAKQNELHHHFSLNRHFHGRRLNRSVGEGGKFPIYDEYFVDGVMPTVEAWKAVFVRAYAAVAEVIDSAAENPELKFVKKSF